MYFSCVASCRQRINYAQVLLSVSDGEFASMVVRVSEMTGCWKMEVGETCVMNDHVKGICLSQTASLSEKVRAPL